ncbi:hypothetical protein D0Z07_8821 [Hyphodiscus hymeniophilus]|uniref:DUF676 domain-containing protein n=1 Tax=Hyphodiscus hymeniophilus TaxID=353542 RepID=A0A9P6VDW6_9HELO|nr:hypothetical protein D0Z07_8821 [Hyphodiscus hymeniophilus]
MLDSIIAIHGLSGDSFTTWTHKNKILWLRDLLPYDLKDVSSSARIMTYGYDVGMFGKARTSRVFDFAGNMLSSIKDKRTGDAKHRPLIFLAHSLGGIVLKQALIIAWHRSTLWADLRCSVRHIIFFGTPHHGTVSVVNLVRGVGSSALGVASDSVLRDLELWSGPSMQVNASFIDDVASNFTWTTVVENEDLVLGNRMVHQGSAVLLQSQETVIILDADHNGIYPKIFLRAYRGLHHLELEKTHLHGQGLEYESHLELARKYCDQVTEVFDRACITKREGRLKQRRSRASSSTPAEIWNQAFNEFNRIAIDLGKVGKLPIDLLNLRARALYEAGRMAAEIQSTSSSSQELGAIAEESSTQNHRLSGETLLSVPDPSGFYREAKRIVERFRQETDLTETPDASLAPPHCVPAPGDMGGEKRSISYAGFMTLLGLEAEVEVCETWDGVEVALEELVRTAAELVFELEELLEDVEELASGVELDGVELAEEEIDDVDRPGERLEEVVCTRVLDVGDTWQSGHISVRILGQAPRI